MRNSDKITYLDGDEVRRLLAVIKSKRDAAIFRLAYRHGLRASEIGTLLVADVNLQRGRIRVRRCKGSDGGEYPMHPDDVKAVRAYLRERNDEDSPYLFLSNRRDPISRRMLDVLMKRYCAQARISGDRDHFHTLKHSCATNMLDAGAELRYLQDWLGHRQIANTVVYTKLTSRNRERTARELFARMPI